MGTQRQRSPVILFALMLVLSSILQCAKEEKPLQIGALLSLTGSAAQFGEYAQKGIDLALKEVNDAGGVNGRKVKVIYEDTKSNAKDAVSAMNKLIQVHKVPVIIGPVSSGAVLACGPVANETKTVILSPTASSPAITDAGDFVFRNRESAVFQGIAMAEFCYSDLGVQEATILYVNEPNGVGYKNAFEKRFKELGGSIIHVDSFEEGASDFRAHLTKLKRINPKVVYTPGLAREIGHILKQAEELSLETTFLSTQGVETPELISIAGEAAEGLILSTISYDPEHPATEALKVFVEKYQKTYGEIPDVFSAATGYDAFKLVVMAIEKGGYTSEGIRDALYTIKDYPGVSGKTSFDANGDVSKPIAIKIVKGGQFVPYTL